MSWITKLVDKQQITYWMPDELPENTEDWQINQMRKSYLKPDGSLTGHPGWYFGNQAYASDEYFYYNEGWYTIIDNRPEEIDENGNHYIIVETPSDEWEIFDTYKVKKIYKKYLHNVTNKPKYEFGKIISHSFNFDDENMIATDNYEVSVLNQEELELQKNEFLKKLRVIRNYILEKTDYLVIQSKEKNQELSHDFIFYRQSLRDLPQNFDFFILTEDDCNKVLDIFLALNSALNIVKENLEIEISDISFFPPKPIQILI